MPTRGLINPELLTGIADAIRAKNGTSARMTPAQMAQAISYLGLSDEIKQALLNCFAHVAWIDDQGQTYYDALENALYPPAELTSISAVFEQGQTVIYNTDSLDVLKPMLTVTAHYTDGTSGVVTNYTLSGTLTVGTSTITVSYGGKTTTFTVTVSKDIDYTENPLANVAWHDEHQYQTTTGVMREYANYHCTDKFTAQNCLYSFTTSNGNNKSPKIHVWDTDGNYMGYIYQNSMPLKCVQLNANYQYAIEYQNSVGDGSDTEISFMPVDNRETAVEPFEISLAEYKDVLETATSGGVTYFRIPANDINFSSAYGVTHDNRLTTINRVSCFCVVANSTPVLLRLNELRVALDYVRGLALEFAISGITTIEDMQAYLEENQPVVRFN